jgi:hypothetical protein
MSIGCGAMSEEKESSLLELLSDTKKQESIEGWLKTVEKYGAVLDRIERLIDKVDKSNIAQAFIKGMSKKAGVDLSSNPLQTVANSPLHSVLFSELNKLPQEQLQVMLGQFMAGAQQQPPVKKKK